MERPIFPGLEIRVSRIAGWEDEPKRLWYQYFPDIPEAQFNSPLFAHIIALQFINEGEEIPKEVIDVVSYFAQKNEIKLRARLEKWNTIDTMIEAVISEKEVGEIKKLFADSFGRDNEVSYKNRIKLMDDALKIEDSLFSSISVN